MEATGVRLRRSAHSGGRKDTGREVRAPAVIELVTLGGSTVLRDRVPLSVSPKSPEFLLLVRLSLRGPASPEQLVSFLWPDEAPEEGRRRLDGALDALRELLGPEALRMNDDPEAVELDPGRVTADVERFREALAGDRPRDALALYRGPFLEGLEVPDHPAAQAWIEKTRMDLAAMARRARDEIPWEDDRPDDLRPRLFQELRSRRTFHVALLYLGFAWGSLEICSTLVQMELLTNTVFVALLAFHVVGFPLGVWAAWLLETGRADRDASALPGLLGKLRLRAVHLLTLFAVLAAGSGVGWLVLQWGERGGLPTTALWAGLPDEKHIAVLPFHIVGDDPRTRDFADGLMETLTSQLTGVEGLTGMVGVISSADIRGRSIRSPSEAHAAFGVNLAIAGSFIPTGDSVRVTVNLVDAVRGRQFDQFQLSESVRHLDRLQQGILAGLRRILDLELETDQEVKLASGGTENPQAYGLQVRARGHLQRYEREENLDRALELFRRALDHDPEYVLALAGIGEAHRRKYDLTGDPAELERAREAVLAARDLDDGIAQVHVSLGLIHEAEGRYEDALAAYHRALGLEPHSVDALLGMGAAYRSLREHRSAEEAYLRAQNVRSGDWRIHNGLGVLYQDLGRFREARDEFRRVVELTPDNARGWSNLGAMYMHLGRMEEAVESLERSLAIERTSAAVSNLASLSFYHYGDYERAAELYEEAVELRDHDYRLWLNLAAAYSYLPGKEELARDAYRNLVDRARAAWELNRRDPAVTRALAIAHAKLGDGDRARILARQALELAPGDPATLFTAGEVHEALGDREEAIRLIEEALAKGYSRDLFERMPSLADLRADPDFQAPSPEADAGTDESHDHP